MKISKWEFEKELNSLLEAALSAKDKNTAKRYIVQAYNKINGYDNIPYELQLEYKRKIAEAEAKLNL